GRGGGVRLRGAFTRRFYLIVAIEVAIGFGAAMSIHNIDYYFAAKYNVNSAQLGTVVGLQQLAMAALMLYMPRLSDRVGGPLKVYIAVSSASVPLLIAMTFTNNFILAASLFLIRSVLMNVATPLFDAFVMRLVPRDLRGIASSILSLSWTLPAGGGRAVGGWLLDKNLELPLRLTAAIYAAAIAALAAMFRDELGGGEGRAPSAPLYTSKKPPIAEAEPAR
ncbi:MAG: MFS transporter, partial [Desulfurococcales archaeon]|nr:MFS transporter [Desulfurococcales archaeon]